MSRNPRHVLRRVSPSVTDTIHAAETLVEIRRPRNSLGGPVRTLLFGLGTRVRRRGPGVVRTGERATRGVAVHPGQFSRHADISRSR